MVWRLGELGAEVVFGGGPVARLTGDEFAKVEGESLIDRVSQYFEQRGSSATDPQLGEVLINRRGIRDSWYHGKSKIKASSYYAVTDVIEKGNILEYQRSYGNEPIDRIIMAAPIRVGSKDNVISLVLKRDINVQRYYVHEVFEKESAQAMPNDGATKELSGTKPGRIGYIIQNVLSVNDQDASKIVDENGEPLVVYHGTQSGDFELFETEASEYGLK